MARKDGDEPIDVTIGPSVVPSYVAVLMYGSGSLAPTSAGPSTKHTGASRRLTMLSLQGQDSKPGFSAAFWLQVGSDAGFVLTRPDSTVGDGAATVCGSSVSSRYVSTLASSVPAIESSPADMRGTSASTSPPTH